MSLLFRPPGEDPLASPVPREAAWARPRAFGARRPAPRPRPTESEPAAAEPVAEAAPTTRTRLHAPAFSVSEAAYGDTVTASVAFEPGSPDTVRQVTLELLAVSEDGDKNRIDGKPDVVVRQGRAEHAFILHRHEFPDDQGAPRPALTYVFTASHPEAEAVESPPLRARDAAPEETEEVILYSPSREEYLVLTSRDALDALRVETGKPAALRERSRAAWAIPDPAKRRQAIEEVDAETRRIFGGDSTGEARSGVEELLLVQGHKAWGRLAAWTYLPHDTERKLKWNEQKGFQRVKPRDAQRLLDKVLKQGSSKDRETPLLDGSLKAKLFSSPPRSGQAWKWVAPGSAAKDKPAHTAEMFEFSAEAAVARYMAGWSGGLDFNPHKQTLKFGLSGEASVSAFEGRVTGTLHLPDPRGVNLVRWLDKVKHIDLYQVDTTRLCLMRLALQGTLSAFVGAKVEAALAFPSLCFEGQSEGKQKAEAGGRGSAFVGAQGRLGAKAAIEWADGRDVPFAGLAEIGYEAGVSMGAGAEAGLKVDYADGRFLFQASAAVTWGLGVRGGLQWSVDAKEGWKLLGHLLDCVDFRFIGEVSAAAYRAYSNYATLHQLSGEIQARAQVALAKQASDWALAKVEAVRRWFLGREAQFLKAKIQVSGIAGARSTMAKMSPESLGIYLASILETRQEEDFRNILFILGSTVHRVGRKGRHPSPDHKLKWVLRYISDVEIPDEGPRREAMKEQALRIGIEKMRAFGEGLGYQDRLGVREEFRMEFQRLLAENGISIP